MLRSRFLVHRVYCSKLGVRCYSQDKATEALGGKAIREFGKEDESKRSGLPGVPSSSRILANHPAPSLFNLNGRTVIVTGGGRGIGLTVAHALLESGASVAAVDLLPEPTEPFWTDAQKVAQRSGLSLSYDRLDVTDQGQVDRTVSSIFDKARDDAPVRGMLTAAGIQMLRAAVDYKPEEIRKILDVNVTGTFLCANAFAREWMKEKGEVGRIPEVAETGGASIVMIGSMSGHVANLGLECAAYNASKAAVNQLGKNLAMEWGTKGIRVNTLSPGYIKTAMTATLLEQKPELLDIWMRGTLMGRLSTADEFRGPCIFLLSDASSYMTGADILVDGGHTAT